MFGGGDQFDRLQFCRTDFAKLRSHRDIVTYVVKHCLGRLVVDKVKRGLPLLVQRLKAGLVLKSAACGGTDGVPEYHPVLHTIGIEPKFGVCLKAELNPEISNQLVINIADANGLIRTISRR